MNDCLHPEEVFFRPRTFLYQQCLDCGRVKRSKEMCYDDERETDNELTIRTETEDQTDQILRVLSIAEQEGEIDFPFDVIRNTYPR